MSIYALDWAFKTDLNTTEKIVLVTLAFRHNAKTGQCNPKLSTLSGMTGLAERSVRYALRRLETGGYIGTFPCRNHGKQTSNKYVLNTENLVFQAATPRRLKQKTKCREMPPETVVRCPPIDKEVRKVSTSPDSLVNNSSVLKFPKKGTAK